MARGRDGGVTGPPGPAGRSGRPAHERRRFIRLPAEARVRYRSVTVEAEALRGTSVSRDVSACGIVFATTRSLAGGLVLQLQVDLGPRVPSVRFLGRVARVRAAEGAFGPWYDVGVEFLKIEVGDRERLLAFAGGEHGP